MCWRTKTMPKTTNTESEADILKREKLRHDFELSRITAIWKEKERRVLTKMQYEHDQSLERTLSTAADAIELEERSRVMQADAEIERMELLQQRGLAVLASTRASNTLIHSSVQLTYSRKPHGGGGGGWCPDPNEISVHERANLAHAHQKALRAATATKERETRQRMDALKADAHARQFEKQEQVRKKAKETAERDRLRVERMRQERELRIQEQAVKSKKAAMRLEKLVQTQSALIEQKRIETEEKAKRVEEQRIVSEWINEVVVEEKREKSKAQALKVQHAQHLVRQQEENKQLLYLQRQEELNKRSQRREEYENEERKEKSDMLKQRIAHQEAVAQRVERAIREKRNDGQCFGSWVLCVCFLFGHLLMFFF